jgi:hypothetical protein
MAVACDFRGLAPLAHTIENGRGNSIGMETVHRLTFPGEDNGIEQPNEVAPVKVHCFSIKNPSHFTSLEKLISAALG